MMPPGSRRRERVIGTLSRREREVIELCVWSGLDYAMAAEALGIPVGTVRSRLSRARKKLERLVPPAGAVPAGAPREPGARRGQAEGSGPEAAAPREEHPDDHPTARVPDSAALASPVPVPVERYMPADRQHAIREHLISEFRESSATAVTGSARTGRERRTRAMRLPRVAVISAVAVTAAVTGVVIAATSTTPSPRPPQGRLPPCTYERQ